MVSVTMHRLAASTHRMYRFKLFTLISGISLWLCAESYAITKISLKETGDLMEIIYGRGKQQSIKVYIYTKRRKYT